MLDRLEVWARGQRFAGWKSAQITRALDAVAGGFELGISDARPWPLAPGTDVELRYGSDVLLTGHVDAVRAGFENESHDVSVSGRDRTADLVDCSSQVDPEFLDSFLHEIAAKLADPFGIQVSLEGDPGEAFPRFAVQPGESCWAAIERACRLRGMLATTAGDGALLLTRPSEQVLQRTILVQGKNLLAATLHYDHAERFAVYTVRGQRAGNDDDWGATVAEIQGESRDEEITRIRPLILIAEGMVTEEDAQLRAEWEATVRAARSARIEAKVQGWRQVEGGPLWGVNALVRVEIPAFRLSNAMLINRVAYSLDDGGGGTITDLELVRADAYRPEPAVPEEENPFGSFLGEWEAEAEE